MNMKERAFRKFESLIPEGLMVRLKALRERIKEVLRE